MRLLPGSSRAVVAENIRSLKQSGLSEHDAVARANREARGDDLETPDDSSDPTDVGTEDAGGSGRSWVVVTKDFSGLGWAKRLQEEGEDVVLAVECPETESKDRKLYERVGSGWLTVVPLADAVATRKGADVYWLFAENNFPEQADRLRREGQRVFGTSALTDKLEHDRAFGVQIAEECGLESPATQEFSSRQEGLSFLDANPDTAYVFKPDDGKFNYLTFVPVRKEGANANRETYTYLEHMKQEPGTYILQERIDGTELNAEAWFYEGEPFFSTITLEAKRKNVGDLGEMAGCAGDFTWVVPLDSPVIAQTIGQMFDYYRKEAYTGFADVNIILTEKGPRFLEVCNRFGYNAHVTLFLGLAQDSFANLMADFIDGKVETIPERFKGDVGGSLTLFLDHPRGGLPVHVDPDALSAFYPFDGYKEDDTFLLAGYSSEVGIVVAIGATLEAAAAACLDLVTRESVSFPDMYYRTDLGKANFPNAPLTRYQALQAQGLA